MVAVYRCFGVLALIFALDAAAAQLPDTVSFPSRDGKTQLTGYLFKPGGAGPHPAIVMLHGRAGPFSTGTKGIYTAQTLSRRHQAWGEFWAARGYEYPLFWGLIAFAILIRGGCALSLDRKIGREF